MLRDSVSFLFLLLAWSCHPIISRWLIYCQYRLCIADKKRNAHAHTRECSNWDLPFEVLPGSPAQQLLYSHWQELYHMANLRRLWIGALYMGTLPALITRKKEEECTFHRWHSTLSEERYLEVEPLRRKTAEDSDQSIMGTLGMIMNDTVDIVASLLQTGRTVSARVYNVDLVQGWAYLLSTFYILEAAFYIH